MGKTTIQKDEIGLFVVCAGQVVRPIEATMHAEGSRVDVRQCSGSIAFAVGRDTNAKKGVWQDYWLGCEVEPGASLDKQCEAFRTSLRIGSSDVMIQKFIAASKAGQNMQGAAQPHPLAKQKAVQAALDALDNIPGVGAKKSAP